VCESTHFFQLHDADHKGLIQAVAAFVCSLGHPNLLKVAWHLCKPAPPRGCACVLEVGMESECCNGGTLAQALRQGLFCRSVVREQWAVALPVLRDIAQAMHFLHSQGICHGGLSPDTVHLQVRFICTQQAPSWAPYNSLLLRCHQQAYKSSDEHATTSSTHPACSVRMRASAIEVCARAGCTLPRCDPRLPRCIEGMRARWPCRIALHLRLPCVQHDEEKHWGVGSALAVCEATAKVGGIFTTPIIHRTSHDSPASRDPPVHTVLAPEAVKSGRGSKASDLYAFGVIMWALIVGCPVRSPQYAPPVLPCNTCVCHGKGSCVLCAGPASCGRWFIRQRCCCCSSRLHTALVDSHRTGGFLHSARTLCQCTLPVHSGTCCCILGPSSDLLCMLLQTWPQQ
jgi:serine/threonine protein kinase